MKDGMRVQVRLIGEDANIWHNGVVIKARKKWVELDADDKLSPFIADENTIVEWKEAFKI